MNVFILCTGRCGSVSFINACQHIENYSASHESRVKEVLAERINFPANHIEADNRLSWFLGRLDAKYGNDAFYVHLIRNEKENVASLNKRWRKNGIIPAFAEGIHMRNDSDIEIVYDYYRTVNENIKLFLKNKNKKLTIHTESLTEGFISFWNFVEARGDLNAAIKTLKAKSNSSETDQGLKAKLNRKLYLLKQSLKK